MALRSRSEGEESLNARLIRKINKPDEITKSKSLNFLISILYLVFLFSAQNYTLLIRKIGHKVNNIHFEVFK